MTIIFFNTVLTRLLSGLKFGITMLAWKSKMYIHLLGGLLALDSMSATSIDPHRISPSPKEDQMKPLLEYSISNLRNTALRQADSNRIQIEDPTHFHARGAGMAGGFQLSLQTKDSLISATGSTFGLSASSNAAAKSLVSSGDDTDAVSSAQPSKAQAVNSARGGRGTSEHPTGLEPNAGGSAPSEKQCAKSCSQHCFTSSNESIFQTCLNEVVNLKDRFKQIRVDDLVLTDKVNHQGDELDQTKAELVQTKAELVQTKAELIQTTANYLALTDKVNSQKTELDEIKAELVQTKAELIQTTTNNLALTDKVNLQEAEQDKTKAELTQTTSELAHMKNHSLSLTYRALRLEIKMFCQLQISARY